MFSKNTSNDVSGQRCKQHNTVVVEKGQTLPTQLVTFSLTYSSKYSHEPITASRCFCPCTVTLLAVSLDTCLTLSSLSFFEIIQHFLALGKYPKSGPRVLRVSHHFLISSIEPAPHASSSNQHCLILDVTPKLVISCCTLNV